MGVRNYLIEGLSGTGKTSVCNELQRRGYHAIHGDRELAYQGDPRTGAPLDGFAHEHHIWDVDEVRALRCRSSAVAPETSTASSIYSTEFSFSRSTRRRSTSVSHPDRKVSGAG